jgi:hypothetical protein
VELLPFPGASLIEQLGHTTFLQKWQVGMALGGALICLSQPEQNFDSALPIIIVN